MSWVLAELVTPLTDSKICHSCVTEHVMEREAVNGRNDGIERKMGEVSFFLLVASCLRFQAVRY